MDSVDKKDTSDQFLRLLLPNQKQIGGYILAYVPNHADAEDILQETLSILWKKFDQYKPGTDFLAYALTIAKYEIKNYYRMCSKSGKTFLGDHLQQIIDHESPSIVQNFNTRIEALKECIKKLTGDDFRLIQCRYEQEMSLTKLGQQFGISSPAAFKRLSNIHSRLIRCIRLKLTTENLT